MKIGIQISLNLENKGGNEEYICQLLKYFPEIGDYKNHQFFLLAPFISNEVKNIAGYIPKVLKWPFKFGWTQIRLGWEMLKNKPDVLFVPAHNFPIFCPKLIVTIQGLEFKVVSKMYSWFQKLKLNFFIKRNIKKAYKIIVPSQSTKDDLIKYYQIDEKKIFVIYHGINNPTRNVSQVRLAMVGKYILYLGSGHKRKNIKGLIEAYKILKNKYYIEHDLIIVGTSKNVGDKGCPTSNIGQVSFIDCVNDEKKWELLRNADVFVFISFAEGFGFPVLEAQKAGVPVVASDISVFRETLQDSAILVDPCNPDKIAEEIYKIISDRNLRDNLINKGFENVKRFNWKNCAEQTFKIICE